MSTFELYNVNLPNADVNALSYNKASDTQLSAFLRSDKALKSYYKARLKELGKISLGNITSYYECLKTIQTMNEEIAKIKSILNARHTKNV